MHILAQILMWTDNHRCDIYEQGQYEASVKLNSPSHYSVQEDIKQPWEWTQQQLLRTYEYNTKWKITMNEMSEMSIERPTKKVMW